jgi:dTDP-4-amino-4,6-dideoxygalactose transaminase
LLAPVDKVRTPRSTFGDVTPFLYYIQVPADERQSLRDHLKAQGVDTGIHWQPGHWFSLLKDVRKGDMSVTDRVGREILSLPLHSRMDPEAVGRVCRAVASFFSRN